MGHCQQVRCAIIFPVRHHLEFSGHIWGGKAFLKAEVMTQKKTKLCF